VERPRGAATAIRTASCQQPLGVRSIDLRPLRLPIAMMRRALVPREPEPAHGVEDRVDVLLRRARPVGVLDAEDENAAVMARVEPVEERGSSAANVKMAGGTRSEAHADGLGHRFLFYSERRERDAGRGAVKPRPDRQNL